jgi:preprotein translocase subunit SecG
LVQILLVHQAGNQATNAENSNFMGNQAGRSNKEFLTQISWAFNLVLTQLVLLLQNLVKYAGLGTTNAQIQISLVRVLWSN